MSRVRRRQFSVNYAASIVRRLAGRRAGPALCVVALGALATLPAPPVAIAQSEPCANQQFRTGIAASLPDCRAYEQASPVYKNGGAVEGFPSIVMAPEDGSGITWYSISGTAIPASGGSTGSYTSLFSRRTGSDWQTERLSPPKQAVSPDASFPEPTYLGLTPDGRYAVAAGNLVECEGVRCSTLWVIDTQTEAATLIASTLGERRFAFDGASRDGSRIFFETKAQLTPQAVEGAPNLYMWDRATGALSSVGVLPGLGGVPETGAFGGPFNWPENEVFQGGAMYGLAVGAHHAISPSGDQIFFTVPEAMDESGEVEVGQLFLRQGLTGPDPTTLRISEPNIGLNTPEPGSKPAAFQEATPDGNHVFFLSSAKLTNDATTGTAEEGKDLYRWDRETEQLVDITPDPSDADGAQVIGLLGASESGRSGYFVARGTLAAGGVATEPNIYRFDQTEPGQIDIRFVATLNPISDESNWVPWSLPPGETVHTLTGLPPRSSRVDASADTLLFTSVNQLTSFANESVSCMGPLSSPLPGAKPLCREVYRFSAATGSLACVSCNPSGSTNGGEAYLQPEFFGGGLGATQRFRPAATFPRNLSANGQRIFFESTDPLVVGDTNGTEGCSIENCDDVYEWETSGEGSCTAMSVSYSPQSGGCIYLISPGGGPVARRQGSYFLDASTDGSNVYIATNNPLVPVDTDEAFDAYDVSIGGGLAPQLLRPGTSQCRGEECQSAASPAPTPQSPASNAIAGPGNVHQHQRKVCPRRDGSRRCKKKHHRHPRKKHSGQRHSSRGHKTANKQRNSGNGAAR